MCSQLSRSRTWRSEEFGSGHKWAKLAAVKNLAKNKGNEFRISTSRVLVVLRCINAYGKARIPYGSACAQVFHVPWRSPRAAVSLGAAVPRCQRRPGLCSDTRLCLSKPPASSTRYGCERPRLWSSLNYKLGGEKGDLH